MSKLCQINRVKDSFDNDTLKLIISVLAMIKCILLDVLTQHTVSFETKIPYRLITKLDDQYDIHQE